MLRQTREAGKALLSFSMAGRFGLHCYLDPPDTPSVLRFQVRTFGTSHDLLLREVRAFASPLQGTVVPAPASPVQPFMSCVADIPVDPTMTDTEMLDRLMVYARVLYGTLLQRTNPAATVHPSSTTPL